MLTETEQPSPSWSERIAWGPKEVLQAVGIVIAGFIFLSGAVALVAAAADLELSKPQLLGISLVGTFVMDCALIALAAIFTLGKYRLRWSALGFRPLPLDRAWVPAAAVVGIFLIVGANALLVKLMGLEDLLPKVSPYEDIGDSRALMVMLGITVILAAPIAEETFFRGFMFGGLAKRLGFFWAALASGLLFSLPHGQPMMFVPITLIGVLFAWVYVYTGSLWTSIAAHLVWNLISLTVILGGWAD
jgi:membrane protease YdiL (CAAX protease family)